MIGFYLTVFLFWLVAVVMVFWNTYKLPRRYSFYQAALEKQTYVFMCMIIATTFIMERMYPDFLEAWVMRQW